MREIKFRAWDENKKEFIFNVDYKNGRKIIVTGNEIIEFNSSLVSGGFDGFGKWERTFYIRDLDIKCMQYTDLKDKNGVDIYEGDMVEFRSMRDKAIGEVVFHECSFQFKIPVDNEFESPYRIIGKGWYGTEIIGNKYENPELLENQ